MGDDPEYLSWEKELLVRERVQRLEDWVATAVPELAGVNRIKGLNGGQGETALPCFFCGSAKYTGEPLGAVVAAVF